MYAPALLRICLSVLWMSLTSEYLARFKKPPCGITLYALLSLTILTLRFESFTAIFLWEISNRAEEINEDFFQTAYFVTFIFLLLVFLHL